MSPTICCAECDAKFTKQSDCVRHYGVHLPDSSVSCQYCDFTSKRQDSLKRHTARYHSDNDKIVKNDDIIVTESHQKPIFGNTMQSLTWSDASEFDKRLQLPNNFIYSGSSQSVSI